MAERSEATHALMTRAEIIRQLHHMVDQLAIVPAEWFEEGFYPVHRATFVARDDPDCRITLVVGVEAGDDDG